MELSIINSTALIIAITHTLAGPDHYLPFVMIARARKWSLKQTLTFSIVCGIAHVLSSVLLGFIGITIGSFVKNLVGIESMRGELAAWGLISFGFIYGSWGLRNTWFKKHSHTHPSPSSKKITPWVILIIFALGPCEPLIPVLMYPAMDHGLTSVFLVAGTFGFFTILSMTSMVWILYTGMQRIQFNFLSKYTHAIAGYSICMSGVAIQLLGL